jgi:hypothetical protein
MKKWTVGMGKRERERIRALAVGVRPPDAWPVPREDEITRERGVILLKERGGEDATIFIRTWSSFAIQNRREADLP